MKTAEAPDWHSLSNPILAKIPEQLRVTAHVFEASAGETLCDMIAAAGSRWAAELGLTHEALYRSLAQLKREDVIALNAESIRLQPRLGTL